MEVVAVDDVLDNVTVASVPKVSVMSGRDDELELPALNAKFVGIELTCASPSKYVTVGTVVERVMSVSRRRDIIGEVVEEKGMSTQYIQYEHASVKPGCM